VHNTIVIRGARVHNLKNISLELPRNKLIVITGVSGSGKSSLAFDTIYAEGQRRYVESLSAYARQFLERMDKPDVDLIQGISPAMAIEQKTNTRNPRSTVGTTTEIYDYLRLLFARIGKTYCRQCGKLVTRDTVRSVLEALKERAGDQALRAYVVFPLPLHPQESLGQAIQNIKKEGFVRLLIRGDIFDLEGASALPKCAPEEVLVLVDRLVFRAGEEDPRWADSLETAFASGNGRAAVVLVDSGTTLNFNSNFACSDCHIIYEEPEPRLFSFNNPFGACPECQGFGRAVGIDMTLVVPDPSKTLRQGAIQPWTTTKFKDRLRDLVRVAPAAKVRLDVPFAELSEAERRVIAEGFGEFGGLQEFFGMVEKKAYKIFYRVLLSRYRGYTTCPACGGARLRPDALQVRIDGKNIADIVRLTVEESFHFIKGLTLSSYEQAIARRIVGELTKRLGYLEEVGIGYLTLDRLSSTLSGGEAQRINLATSLGSTLAGAVYVLDEPSIGLHPRDNARLIRILKALRDVGNTVIVVEHDADMMRASDLIVDMGPKAGERGGEIVFQGTPEEITKDKKSLTGGYLAGRTSIPIPSRRREPSGRLITIQGAHANNIRNLDVEIPLGMLVCVTGVSGSGKSTLVHDILYNSIRRTLGDFSVAHPHLRELKGVEHISAVEMVDQSPIGRTPRSNPVTYVQVFDQIRGLLADTQAARIQGMKPGNFSFNVPGGRCEACEGDGVVKVEMQFLADLFLPCDVCKGKRYKQEVLDIRYRGKNVDDILGLTVREAIQFFGEDPVGRRVARQLKVLDDVGLGYIRLGQPATSLSGGEAQRIKLAAHLRPQQHDVHTLFILDEPTTGLHFDDIATLMRCFDTLIEAGNSILLIEHNLDVIKCADYIIDMGPEAGDRGGNVVARGTPEEVTRVTASATGKFLTDILSG
jgi:excinuclease ABC subunit A